MLEAIGGTGVDDDRRHVRRRIAGPISLTLLKLSKRACVQADIGPEFPAFDRPHRACYFNTLGGDLPGKVEGRIGDLHVDVAL